MQRRCKSPCLFKLQKKKAKKIFLEFFFQDSVIIPRISMYPEDYRAYTDKTIEHMEHFAKEGFRTLVLAYRVINEEDYRVSEIEKRIQS